MTTIIEKVDYLNKKCGRTLESALTTWFRNPKDLGLVEPRMRYPFNYNKWLTLNSNISELNNFIIKEDSWIVGFSNVQLDKKLRRVFILHLFIDPHHRKKGFATKMLEYLELLAQKKNMLGITIQFNSNNYPVERLLSKSGYKNNANNGFNNSLRKERKKIKIFGKKL